MLKSRAMLNLIKISARPMRTSAVFRNVEAQSAGAEKLSIPVPEGSQKPINPKLDTIVNQIAGLNLLEVSELSSLLKSKLNLPDTALMPVGFAQGSAPAASGKSKLTLWFQQLNSWFYFIFS